MANKRQFDDEDEWEGMRGRGKKPRNLNKYAHRRAERAIRQLDPEALEEYSDDE